MRGLKLSNLDPIKAVILPVFKLWCVITQCMQIDNAPGLMRITNKHSRAARYAFRVCRSEGGDYKFNQGQLWKGPPYRAYAEDTGKHASFFGGAGGCTRKPWSFIQTVVKDLWNPLSKNSAQPVAPLICDSDAICDRTHVRICDHKYQGGLTFPIVGLDCFPNRLGRGGKKITQDTHWSLSIISEIGPLIRRMRERLTLSVCARVYLSAMLTQLFGHSQPVCLSHNPSGSEQAGRDHEPQGHEARPEKEGQHGRPA